MKSLAIFSAAASLLVAGPAHADAGAFTLVNGAGANLKDVSIRRFGTQDWRPLGAGAAPGARAAVDFSDPDCAFDIRATVNGQGEVVWPGVNLCEVKVVTLNRAPSGAVWVDYE